MDKLQALKVFVTVVKENSFAEAANSLNLSAPMISRYVAWLEQSLNARLINRTTRSFSLTEAGTRYFHQAVQILDAVEEADMIAGDHKAEPRGILRISVSTSFGQSQLMPVVSQFLKQHPETKIELNLDDRLVNLVEERFDLGIRITQKLDPGLIARKICPCKSVLCASPDYLKKKGTPNVIEDLAQHACLIYSHFLQQRWQFTRDNKMIEVEVKSRLQINNIYALLMAALKGIGITYQPTYLVGDEIRKGKLKVITLKDCHPVEPSIYAIYPSRNYLPAKVRAFIDAMLLKFSPPPWDRF